MIPAPTITTSAISVIGARHDTEKWPATRTGDTLDVAAARTRGHSKKEHVMANPFVHVELHTTDLARAREFYTGLFGWKLQDVPMPGNSTYTMIDVGGGTGGGMMSAQRPGEPSHWMAYVGVDDIHASTKKARRWARRSRWTSWRLASSAG
jgi:predicted enzyme related to lactoylglutathione lyase